MLGAIYHVLGHSIQVLSLQLELDCTNSGIQYPTFTLWSSLEGELLVHLQKLIDRGRHYQLCIPHRSMQFYQKHCARFH